MLQYEIVGAKLSDFAKIQLP